VRPPTRTDLDTGTRGGKLWRAMLAGGRQAHRYIFTFYALSVADIQVAGSAPKTETGMLYNFVLNKGTGTALLARPVSPRPAADNKQTERQPRAPRVNSNFEMSLNGGRSG
jgi:hypothetical protein